MKRRKMLRATTLLISALMIFTLLLGTYFLIYRHFSTRNNQLEAVQKDLLVNFQRSVDETLKTCTQCISSWALEDRVVQFATENELDNYNMVLTGKIIGKSFLYPELDCVFGIFKPGQDVFLTNSGILYGWDLMKHFGFSPEMLEEVSNLPEQEFVNTYYLAGNGNGERLNLFLKRSLLGEPSKELYGFVSLNLQSVVRTLSRLDDHVFFVKQGQEVIFSSDPDVAISDLRILSEPSELLFNLSYGNGVMERNAWVMVLAYGFLFLLLAIAGLYGSVFIARWLNRPMENILLQLSADSGEEIYDEEAYIRDRFVEIKTINQQLEARINAQEQYVKQNMIRDLLYGVVNEDAMTDAREQYGLQKLCGQVALAVLEKKNGEMPGTAITGNITALLEAKIENSVILFLNLEHIVVIAPKVSAETFKREITQAILQIGEWYDVQYTGAVCDGEIRELKELSRLFNEAMRYLQNGDFGYDTLVITAEDINEREVATYYYPLEFEKNIVTSIAGNDFDRAMQILQTILDKNLVEMKLSKAALTELKFAFVGTVKRVLQVLKTTEVELFGEGSILYLELSACKTPKEISGKILEMFSGIRAYMESAYVTVNHALIDQIEDYIRDNYHREDMSLLLLAEHFNLTTGYISKIFKKCRQVNFKEYLSAYRVEKATEILESSPQIRISDLAHQVGYDNANSFIRNFKKLKQVSPGEYKKQK